MLISESYRALNAELHRRKNDFGAGADQWSLEAIRDYQPKTILDYGCGKQALKTYKPRLDVRCYDPAINDLAAPPEPAEMVVCRCVLEHVEPECLEEVLDDIKRLAERVVVIKVTLVPSSLTLADGRNAHLILESTNWWMERLLSRWELHYAKRMKLGLRFIGVPHG